MKNKSWYEYLKNDNNCEDEVINAYREHKRRIHDKYMKKRVDDIVEAEVQKVVSKEIHELMRGLFKGW